MARRQAISPVIATVIIVAVTIAVAIAVAFWMTGIVGLFTGFEKLEIASHNVNIISDNWVITLLVKNTGTTPTTITEIYINNVLVATATAGSKEATPRSDTCEAIVSVVTGTGTGTGSGFTLNPGDTREIKIILKAKDGNTCGITTLNPGVGVEVKLHTTGGKDYPRYVVLSG